jgi:hypothetical protein
MKMRKEVIRELALIGIVIMATMILVILFGPKAEAQSKKLTGKEYHIQLQKENSWENYQANYKKTMLSNAKDARKDKRKKEKANRKNDRFFARLEKIKE